MAANAANQRRKVRGARDLRAETFRNDEVAQHVPGRVAGLMAVKRSFCGRDLTITYRGHCVRDFYQKDASLLGHAEAGLEGIQKPNAQLAQVNLLYKHGRLLG